MPSQVMLLVPIWGWRDTARLITVDTAMSFTVIPARLSRLRRLYHTFRVHTPLSQQTCWIHMFLESSREKMALTLTVVSMLQVSARLQSPQSLLEGTISAVTPRLLEVLEQPD